MYKLTYINLNDLGSHRHVWHMYLISYINFNDLGDPINLCGACTEYHTLTVMFW